MGFLSYNPPIYPELTLLEHRSAQRVRYAEQSAGVKPGEITQSVPNTDKQQQTAASKQSLYTMGRMAVGKITDNTNLAGAYRIQFDNTTNTRVGYPLQLSGTGAFGTRDLTNYCPGTSVVCFLPVNSETCAYILGAIPLATTDVSKTQADMVYAGSRQRVDSAHKTPLNMNANGGIEDRFGGKFLDGLCAGEWGRVTETGLRIFLDSFFAQMGVDEATSISAFYHDQLLRIAGYNLVEVTSGRIFECLQDQDEYIEFEGSTPYPWEQLGLLSKVDPVTEHTDEEWQTQKQIYCAWEPKDNYLQPFSRAQRYGGYLGQGGKRLVVGRPITGDTFTWEGGENQSRNVVVPGLFSESIGLDGRYLLESAKGISIRKRPAILAPTRQNRPEQMTVNTGDCEENYKFSGLTGEGEEHHITGTFEREEFTEECLQTAAGIRDLHAYLFNFSSVHPFVYHRKDFEVKEASDLGYLQGTTETPINYRELAYSQFLEYPEEYTLDIDHRLLQQKYYKNSCGIDFLDDGGVVISDGFGSQIRMTGGSIFISAPGDVVNQSGRDIVDLAGYDSITKARNCVDISATEHDVRVKAEKHMQLLSGNSGSGAMLIENKAGDGKFDYTVPGQSVKAAGILIKSAISPLAISSNEIYLGAGVAGGYTGNIVIDAGKGEGDVLLYADHTHTHVQTHIDWAFGKLDEPNTVYAFQNDAATFPARAYFEGDMVVNGYGLFNGTLVAGTGHIFTKEAEKAGGRVGPIDKDHSDRLQAGLARLSKDLKELPQKFVEFYNITILGNFFGEEKFANTNVLEAAGFGWRPSREYQTTEFVMMETGWQQDARLQSQSLPTWTETSVATETNTTYPYPGEHGYESEVFYTQDLTICDPNSGNSAERGENTLSESYMNPKYAAQEAQSLNKYTVVAELIS